MDTMIRPSGVPRASWPHDPAREEEMATAGGRHQPAPASTNEGGAAHVAGVPK